MLVAVEKSILVKMRNMVKNKRKKIIKSCIMDYIKRKNQKLLRIV